jgi:hypothetical protein
MLQYVYRSLNKHQTKHVLISNVSQDWSTYSITQAHIALPQIHQALGSPVVEDEGKNIVEHSKESRVKMGRQKEGHSQEVKYSNRYLYRLNYPMPNTFRERSTQSLSPHMARPWRESVLQPAGSCLHKRQTTSGH